MSEKLTALAETWTIGEEINQELMDEFNQKWAAIEDSNIDGGLRAVGVATVQVEDWLEQSAPREASSYFILHDEMSDKGWAQTIKGKVYKMNTAYLPPSVGAGSKPVLAVYDAVLVRPDADDVPLADGLTVLVQLEQTIGRSIEVMPVEA